MSYASDLQSQMTPEQYDALIKPIKKQNKKITDTHLQILTPLDVSKVNATKQLVLDKNNKLDKSISKDFVAKAGGGWTAKNPVTVNGIPIYAKYDASGKLTGYAGKSDKRAWINDKQSLQGVWDATGVAKPKVITSEGGGFFKGIIKDIASNPVVNAAVTVGASIYGGPAGVAAWNAAQTKAAGGDLGDVLESAAKGYVAGQVGQEIAKNFGPSADVGGADVGTADMGAGGGLESKGLMSGGAVDLGTATGADLSTAYDMGSVGATGAGGATDASTVITGNAAKAALYGDAGYGAGMTGAETTAYDTGLAAGAAGAGAGAVGAGAAGAGAAGALTDAALIKGGLSVAGGLLQGETASDAASTLAANQAKLAAEVKDMGKFQPVGITTRFGTSSFTTDPVTGAITPSYTLSPEAQAYQDQLAGIATSGLEAGKGLMSLGQQYIGESPEAVRNRYISTQQALLAPQQEQTLAALRTNQMNTGRGGLAFGATSDGLAATNPEMAAYYNSLAQTQRQLAANAETQYQNQVNFGTGLMNQSTTPFTNAFNAQKSVEAAGQQPLTMSTDFAKTAADIGIRQGTNYANAMSPSLESSYKASATDPMATFLQGLSDSDLAVWGLSKVKPSTTNSLSPSNNDVAFGVWKP